MSGRRRSKVAASLIAATAVIGACAASAGAATVVVGSPISGGQDGGDPGGNNGASWTVANFALAEPGAHVTSPVSGVIVSWRAIIGPGQSALRVLRPAGGGAYTGAGTSAGTAGTFGDHTFAANLPIQAGDLIGLDLESSQGIIGANRSGAQWGGWVYTPMDGDGRLPDGVTESPNPVLNNAGTELAFNATVQYSDTPVTTATTPVKKKKCKKKHKRSAESAKKKCKKKKKH